REQIGARLEAVRSAHGQADERGSDASRPKTERQTVSPDTSTAVAQESFFRREGDYWLVIFEGQTVRLRDQKGLHYLACLLAEPGREFHVVDLVIGGRAGPRRPRP